MALPDFSMRQLLEAGVHFGHQTHRWNPKMKDFIFGERANIHILDLSQTVPLLHQALVKVRETAAKGGRVLFVGTKRQASDPLATAAKRCAQYYVNHRWLGGTLTNWRTISNSIARLRELEAMFDSEGGLAGLTKKEQLMLTRERDKLERSLGGIKDMGGIPDLMFVIDTNKEAIAIQEARKLGIPVAAIVDSNCDPDLIDFPVPGNDDASRAIELYCDLIADSVLDGMADVQVALGVDLGESEAPVEPALAETAGAAAAEASEPSAETQPETAADAEEAPAEEAPVEEVKAEEPKADAAAEEKKPAAKKAAAKKPAAKKPAAKKTATKAKAEEKAEDKADDASEDKPAKKPAAKKTAAKKPAAKKPAAKKTATKAKADKADDKDAKADKKTSSKSDKTEA